jgi:hypothetical protein
MTHHRSAPFLLATASTVSLIAGLSTGCTVSSGSSGAPADGGPANGGGASDAGVTIVTALTCSGIFDCVATKCMEGDSVCEDACYAQGSPLGKSQADGLVACVVSNACQDEACLTANCQTELKACVTTVTGPITPIPGSVPPGSVPADLVGSFAIARGGDTTRMVLRADGTGTYQTGSAVYIGSCLSTDSFFYSGTAVVTTEAITIYATGVEHRFTICGGNSGMETLPPETQEIKYTREDADTLKIINAACAARVRDESAAAGKPPDYNIAFYCTERLKRE